MTHMISQDVQIYYENLKNDKPPLLMLHGNGNSVKNWHDLGYVDILKNHFNLILMDCCGYGKSDKPHNPDRYTPELVAKDCIHVLDALNINKTHIYGGSRGANITLLLAKYFPERFLSYCIFDAEIYQNTAHQELHELLISHKDKGMLSVVEQIESWLGRRFPDAIRDDYIANDIDAMIAASGVDYGNLSRVFDGNPAPCCLISSNSPPWSIQMPQFAQENPSYEYHNLSSFTHPELYWAADTLAPIIINFIEQKD